MDLVAVGRGPAAREAARDRVQIQARRNADRGRGKPVVDAVPAEGRDAATVEATSVGPKSEHACPSDPREITSSARDVGIAVEAVGERSRRRVRDSHPATRWSSAFSIACRRRQCLDELALGTLDRVDRADPRQVRGADGGHDADRGPRRSRPGREISPPRTCPSRGPPPRAPARCGGPSGAGRSRCSRCPRLERPEAGGEDGRDRLLGGGLGDAARHADDERIEPGPPVGGDRLERRRSRRRRGRPSRRRGSVVGGRRGRGARQRPRSRPPPGTAWPSVRSPGSATNSCPGSTRRESTAAPRIGRADRVISRPPVERAARRPRRRSAPRPPSRGDGDWSSVSRPRVCHADRGLATGRR